MTCGIKDNFKLKDEGPAVNKDFNCEKYFYYPGMTTPSSGHRKQKERLFLLSG